jgi:ankyrin
MSGRRHAGIRVVIPPGSTCQPTRIICKLVRKEKLTNPPQLAEGEALATRILDMGQARVKFNGQVTFRLYNISFLHR